MRIPDRLPCPTLFGLGLLALFAATAPEATAQTKVLVLPYQPIYRSVPQAKVGTATKLLRGELGKKASLQVLSGGAGASTAAAGERGAAAAKTAAQAEAGLDIQAALKARRAAVNAMLKAPSQATADGLVRAYLLLARAQMWAGKDAGAKASIAHAARMKPTAELPKGEYSRLFRAWFRQAAQQVMKSGAGSLVVQSVLPGARIYLDGRELDVAPVTIDRILPGQHLLSARVEGAPPYGAIIEVKAGKNPKHTASFAGTLGGAAVGEVGAALAENKITADTIQQAVQAGRAAGAQYVVMGGLAQNDADYKVHTYVVQVTTGRLAAMKAVGFDKELLTAESDVLRIVRQLEASVGAFKGDKKPIARVDARISPRSTMNQVSGSPDAPTQRRGRQVKKAKGPRKVFKPLSGGTIGIKDEEN